MDALDFTLAYIAAKNLCCILLEPKQSRPLVGQYIKTSNPDTIRAHVRSGGNVGILGGPIAILDFDNVPLMNQMFLELGHLEPTVETGSGKIHCYVMNIDSIPARIQWQGELVGEIQRGENQYVVCPPSTRVGGPGEKNADHTVPYRWRITDPTTPIYFLPDKWTKYLNEDMVPEVPEWLRPYCHTQKEVNRFFKEGKSDWDGPSVEELIERARQMPKSKTRRYGIKFQCAACAEEGHDRSHDNALIWFETGTYGCGKYKDDAYHKRRIGESLGVISKIREHAQESISDSFVESVKKLAGPR